MCFLFKISNNSHILPSGFRIASLNDDSLLTKKLMGRHQNFISPLRISRLI